MHCSARARTKVGVNLALYKETWMKRLAVVAAVLTLAACKAKTQNTAADTAAAPAMAPAPAATDTGMAGMNSDTGMKADSGMSGMKADTGKKKP